MVDTPTDYKLAQAKLITNRTTCQMSCEAAAPTNTLAHPPYMINNANGNGKGKLEQLGKNILSPTAGMEGLFVVYK